MMLPAAKPATAMARSSSRPALSPSAASSAVRRRGGRSSRARSDRGEHAVGRCARRREVDADATRGQVDARRRRRLAWRASARSIFDRCSPRSASSGTRKSRCRQPCAASRTNVGSIRSSDFRSTAPRAVGHIERRAVHGAAAHGSAPQAYHEDLLRVAEDDFRAASCFDIDLPQAGSAARRPPRTMPSPKRARASVAILARQSTGGPTCATHLQIAEPARRCLLRQR